MKFATKMCTIRFVYCNSYFLYVYARGVGRLFFMTSYRSYLNRILYCDLQWVLLSQVDLCAFQCTKLLTIGGCQCAFNNIRFIHHEMLYFTFSRVTGSFFLLKEPLLCKLFSQFVDSVLMLIFLVIVTLLNWSTLSIEYWWITIIFEVNKIFKKVVVCVQVLIKFDV